MSNPSPWPVTPSIESTSLVTLFDQHTATPTLYSGQLYLVPASGIVFLEEDPLQTSLTIPTGVTCIETAGPHIGTLVEVLASPGPGQFFVNYFNGSIQFGDTVATTVAVTYQGVGSVVLAETINNMNTYIIDAADVAEAINPSNDLQTFTFGTLALPATVTITGSLIVVGTEQEESLTDAQEATLVAGFTVANAGTTWFNITSFQFKGWNGSSVVILG